MLRFNVSCKLEAKLKKMEINLDNLSPAEKLRAQLTDCFEASEKIEDKFIKQLDAENADSAIEFVKDVLFKYYSSLEYCTARLEDDKIFAHWDDCDYCFFDFKAEEIYDNEALKSLRSANSALKKFSQK